MKIKYVRNKISAKICEINNFEYLQKLICNNIYTHSSDPPLFIKAGGLTFSKLMEMGGSENFC